MHPLHKAPARDNAHTYQLAHLALVLSDVKQKHG